MKRQTRYTSEEQIIEKIDTTKAKLLKLRGEASLLDRDMFYNERLSVIDAKCRRIEDATLPRLKNAPAAFRTEMLGLPNIGDKGVVA